MEVQELVVQLQDVLASSLEGGDAELEGVQVRTFEEMGFLGSNPGLVLEFPSGEQYQLQCVRSRSGVV